MRERPSHFESTSGVSAMPGDSVNGGAAAGSVEDAEVLVAEVETAPVEGEASSGAAAEPDQPAPSVKVSPPVIYGNVDLVEVHPAHLRVAGWVWDPSTPDSAVEAELIINGESLGTIRGDVMREDLLAAHIGNGSHAFDSVIKASVNMQEVQNLYFLLSNGDSINQKEARFIDLTGQGLLDDSAVSIETIKPPVKIIFYPDYRENNPYQDLLYSKIDPEWHLESGDIRSAIAAAKSATADQTVIFHLHWTAKVIGSAKTRQDAERRKMRFLREVAQFSRLGGSFVWTIHNVLPHEILFKDIEILFRQELGELAHQILVHAQASVPEITAVYPLPEHKIKVVTHGNYLGVYRNYVSREAARSRFGFGPDDVVFLFLGQLRPYKGLDELISAFSKVRRKFKNARLLIAGKPVHPYRKGTIAARCRVHDGISVFEGYVPDADLQWYFNAADAAVLPYRNILTSGSVLNALSFSVPVIAPKVGMIAEILEEGRNGFLFDVGNEDSLIQAMESLLRLDPQVRTEERVLVAPSVSKYAWDQLGPTLQAMMASKTIEQRLFKTESGTVECGVVDRIRCQNSKNSVAIVILNYNNTDDTKRLVQSIEKMDHKNYDIIIVDNDSDAVSAEFLAMTFEKHTIIKSPENLGYAAGNNLSFEILKDYHHDFIWILNPDTEIFPDACSHLLDAAQDYADATVFGTVICFGHRPDTVWFGGGVVNFDNGLNSFHMYMGQPVNVLPDTPYKVDYVTGASLFCRRGVFETVGLIPEDYFLYFEETQWCLDAQRKGETILMVPSARLFHHKRSEEGGLPSKYYFYYYLRNAILFTARYAPDKLRATEQSVRRNFLAPWLKKIQEKYPLGASYYAALAERGLADGLKDVRGRVDLISLFSRGAGTPVVGRVDVVTSSEIVGWTMNHARPDERLEILVLIDGAPFRRVMADLYRDDLKQAGIGDGFYGFRVALPHYIYDGCAHEISVKLAGGAAFLENTPQTVTLEERPSKYVGRIDGIRGSTLVGWALNLHDPDEEVFLEVLKADTVVARVKANIRRDDLVRAGFERRDAGFEMSLPAALTNGERVRLKIRAEGTDRVIFEREVQGTVGPEQKMLSTLSSREFLVWAWYYRVITPIRKDCPQLSYLGRLRSELAWRYGKRPHDTLVSVVMPVFNRENTVVDAILSVIAQTYTNWELLIVDDGSTDKSVEMIEQLMQAHPDQNISFIRLDQNSGVSAARNAALAVARGQIFAYLDSDNQWYSDYLTIGVNSLLDSPWARSAFAGQEIWQVHRDSAKAVSEMTSASVGPFNRALLENRNYIDLNVFMHRRELYEELGGFREDMRRLVDWEIILRYTAEQSPKFIPALLSRYFIGATDNQITKTEDYERNLEKLKETVANLKNQKISRTKLPSENCRGHIALITSNMDDVDMALDAILENTDLEGIDLSIYCRSSYPSEATGVKDAKLAGISVRNALEMSMPEILADAAAGVPARGDLTLVDCTAIVSRGWLNALRAVARRRKDIGIVVPREVVPGSNSRVRASAPFAISNQDVDVALPACDRIVVDPLLDEAENLVEINSGRPFCLHFAPLFVESVSFAGIVDIKDGGWMPLLVELANSLASLKAAYTPDSVVYNKCTFQ